ncbi:transcription factor bHLH118-like protein [Cinnamomum micranthum f. kanehirae]|uniref:Transcription factor bHLH118-like protein n=1 Tax=Cinnamomum micranthum f. kanehirae TaxID=337451 RepID=A0A443PAS3_9MAGN|nr:transcription factor bHLH118-like protein [Cinnamomum micranthum f. kanehirae]
MDYVAPQNLYFQQGDDLCFQTTHPHHNHIIQGMLTNHPPMSVDSSHELLQKGKPKKLGEPITHDAKGDESHTNKKKKTVHRDVERQRRQEMSTLYMLLRSHLPLEYLKGKKSISDHMCEAANYINHLKAKIEELTEKRDQMRRLITSSSNSRSPQNEARPLSPDISLRATSNGATVLIVDRSGHELPLSRVIAALEEEGLNVISVSTCMNTQSVYNIECESNGPRVDSSGLEQKLRDSICLAH